MRDRGAALGCILALSIFGAGCGHPEKRVVDQYFNAVNQQDQQTLSSFAVVRFDKKVDKWSIAQVSPESKSPAPLPEMVKKVKDVEAELAANKKAANAYALDHLAQVDQVRELEGKGARIPPNLQAVAGEWAKFNQKDRDLKKALAEAKEAAEKEKRLVTLSVGEAADVEKLEGELVSKDLDLELTIGGAPQKYAMTLRKYEMKAPATGGRTMSRWVVYKLEPRA
jgi:hypothetical protein